MSVPVSVLIVSVCEYAGKQASQLARDTCCVSLGNALQRASLLYNNQNEILLA